MRVVAGWWCHHAPQVPLIGALWQSCCIVTELRRWDKNTTWLLSRMFYFSVRPFKKMALYLFCYQSPATNLCATSLIALQAKEKKIPAPNICIAKCICMVFPSRYELLCPNGMRCVFCCEISAEIVLKISQCVRAVMCTEQPLTVLFSLR